MYLVPSFDMSEIGNLKSWTGNFFTGWIFKLALKRFQLIVVTVTCFTLIDMNRYGILVSVLLITVLNMVLLVRTLCMINVTDQVYGVGLET